jgi:hypothetical protein
VTAAGFQAALAHVLVDEATRERLAGDDVGLRRRFSLDDAEIDALRALDGDRLQLMVDAVAGKRVSLLRRALPTTMKLLEGDREGRAVLNGFLRTSLPLGPEGTPSDNRLLADSRRLADHLTARRGAVQPAYLADVADHEALKVALWYSAEASAAAVAANHGVGRAPKPDGWRPRLGEHVVLRAFEHDVLSSVPKARVTRLAIYKRGDLGGLAEYRLGKLVFETLAACTGEPCPAEIAAAVAGGRHAGRVRATIEFALEQGFFAPAPGPPP